MKITERWLHSDSVTGAYVFDDGAIAFWSEGTGSAIDLIMPPDEHSRCKHYRFGCDEQPSEIEPKASAYQEIILDVVENGADFKDRKMTKSEMRDCDRIRALRI